jgi:hypothetical protein
MHESIEDYRRRKRPEQRWRPGPCHKRRVGSFIVARRMARTGPSSRYTAEDDSTDINRNRRLLGRRPSDMSAAP